MVNNHIVVINGEKAFSGNMAAVSRFLSISYMTIYRIKRKGESKVNYRGITIYFNVEKLK
jgi:hypothetical protein